MSANEREMPAARAILIDEEKCIGCNRCVEACQVDLIVPSREKGGAPVVQYPDECWYCGSCVVECPVAGAIRLRHPLMNRPRWIPKERLG